MKYCIVMASPLQVFNGVRFIMGSGRIQKEDKVDLVFNTGFVNANEILKNICAENIFANIYYYKYKSYGVKYRIGVLLSSLFPKVYLKLALKEKHESEKGAIYQGDYDVIISGEQFSMTYGLIQYNKNAISWCYEDGTGSYRPYYGTKYNKRKKIYRMAKKAWPDRIMPEELFVNHPNGCLYDNAKKISPLITREMTDDTDKLLRKVFDYQCPQDVKNYRLIWFLKALEPNHKRNSCESKIDLKIEAILQKYKDQCVVRAHPRGVNTLNKLKELGNGINWELLSMDCVDNNSILMGAVSTAQMTPKLLYDKEPYLIFLLGLYVNEYWNENEEKGRMDMIRWLRSLYRDKSKVFVINAERELEDLLSKLITI